MVVVEVVACIVDDEHELLAAFRPFDVDVNSVSVSGVCHGLALVEGLVADDPTVVASVEDGKVAVAGLRVVAGPYGVAVVLVVEEFVGVNAVLVHVVVFLIGEERIGELVVLCHVASEEERRMADAPEGHHGVLLVFCEVGPVAIVGVAESSVAYCG